MAKGVLTGVRNQADDKGDAHAAPRRDADGAGDERLLRFENGALQYAPYCVRLRSVLYLWHT